MGLWAASGGFKVGIAAASAAAAAVASAAAAGGVLDCCCRLLQAGNEFCVVISCAILALLAETVPLFTAETAVF